MSVALRELARNDWIRWGANYAQYAICTKCGEFKPCRARRYGSWLCLDCFDQR